MEDQDKFVKGFRDGYLLGKYEPELLKKMLTISGSADYSAGLREGNKQQEKEKLEEKIKQAGKGQDKSREIEL